MFIKRERGNTCLGTKLLGAAGRFANDKSCPLSAAFAFKREEGATAFFKKRGYDVVDAFKGEETGERPGSG